MKTEGNHGFTLLELMIVVAILGIIAAIAIPAYRGYISTSYKSQCQNEVAAIKLAESEFFLENNAYFSGPDVGTLQAQSKSIYTPTPTATGNGSMPKECDYSVAATSTTYAITAKGAAGGHLTPNATIVYVKGP